MIKYFINKKQLEIVQRTSFLLIIFFESLPKTFDLFTNFHRIFNIPSDIISNFVEILLHFIVKVMVLLVSVLTKVLLLLLSLSSLLLLFIISSLLLILSPSFGLFRLCLFIVFSDRFFWISSSCFFHHLSKNSIHFFPLC